MAIMRYRLGQRLGREIPNDHGRVQHMIEWNTFSQSECLLSAQREGTCLFGDIGQFYHEDLKKNVLPSLMDKPATALQVLGPLIMTGRATVTTGHCLLHQKTCSLKTCHRHAAGTSCKPFSRRGTQLGTADRDIIYTLTWVSLRRTLQKADVTQENVKGFPVKVIADLLQDLYWVDSVVLDAAMYGTPCG